MKMYFYIIFICSTNQKYLIPTINNKLTDISYVKCYISKTVNFKQLYKVN